MSDRPPRQDPAAQPALPLRESAYPENAFPSRAYGGSGFRESGADVSAGHRQYPVRSMTAGDYWYDRGAEGAGSTVSFGPCAPQGSE